MNGDDGVGKVSKRRTQGVGVEDADVDDITESDGPNLRAPPVRGEGSKRSEDFAGCDGAEVLGGSRDGG